MVPPIRSNVKELNSLSLGIGVLKTRINRSEKVIEIFDTIGREAYGIPMDVTDLRIRIAEKLHRKKKWDPGTFDVKVYLRMEKLEDDYIYNFKALLSARDGQIVDGEFQALDKRRTEEALDAFKKRLDKKLKYEKQFRVDEETDVETLIENLHKKFTVLKEEYEIVFDKKTESAEEATDLMSDCNELAKKRKELFSAEIKDIFDACQFNDVNYLKNEIEKRGTWYSNSKIKTYVNQICKTEGTTFTALHTASYIGDAICTKILLENGADPTAIDYYGYQPLHFAAQQGHVGAIVCLLGADPKLVNAKGEYGRTPLHMSVFNGHIQTTRLLILRKADINEKADGEGGVTPLHVAIENENIEMVKALASYDTLDIHVKDEKGRSSLYYALLDMQEAVVTCLSSHRSWSKIKLRETLDLIENDEKTKPKISEIERMLVKLKLLEGEYEEKGEGKGDIEEIERGFVRLDLGEEYEEKGVEKGEVTDIRLI